MTHVHSPAKFRPNSGSFRDGVVDKPLVGLMIGALVSVVLIVVAIGSLIGGVSMGGVSIGEGVTVPQSSVEIEPLIQSGPAPTKTIEQVLESVQVYVSAQDLKPAVAILEGAIREFPTDPDLRFAMGDLHLMMENHQGAYEQYVAAIEHSDGVDATAQFTAGTLATMIGQLELAEVHYKAAMLADPNNADTPLYLANVQFSLNKLDQAKASLGIAGKMTPDRAQVWATWAQIALRQNKLTIAVEQIQKARRLEPRIAAWSILEAKIQKRAGNPERSIELLSALPQSELENAEVVRLLADSFGMIGRPEEAASRMVDFAQLNTQDPQAAFDAAVWLQRAKQRDEAVLWGRRARDLGHGQAQDWLDSLP